jgi:hypothetical protein
MKLLGFLALRREGTPNYVQRERASVRRPRLRPVTPAHSER